MPQEKPRALLLLSGGFDSPVAGILAQRKGFHVSAIHFSNELFAGKESLEKAQHLAEMNCFEPFYACDVSTELATLSKEAYHKNYFVLMKRLMLRVAEKTALAHHYHALITGENLGQVSSQTLSNLTVITRAVKMPILRPLLLHDKIEILDLAKTFGTYETSKGPEHCDALGPSHPITKGKLEDILEDEKKVGMDRLVEQAFGRVHVLESLRTVTTTPAQKVNTP